MTRADALRLGRSRQRRASLRKVEEEALGLGADAYLVKPFEPDELRQVVEDLLAGSAGGQG